VFCFILKLKPGSILEHSTSAKSTSSSSSSQFATNPTASSSSHVLRPNDTNHTPKWLDLIGTLPPCLASLLPHCEEINLTGHQLCGKLGPSLELMQYPDEEDDGDGDGGGDNAAGQRLHSASFHAVATVTTAFKPHSLQHYLKNKMNVNTKAENNNNSNSKKSNKNNKFTKKDKSSKNMLPKVKNIPSSNSIASSKGSHASIASSNVQQRHLPSINSVNGGGGGGDSNYTESEGEADYDDSDDDEYESEDEETEEKHRQEKHAHVNGRHFIYPNLQLTKQRVYVQNNKLKHPIIGTTTTTSNEVLKSGHHHHNFHHHHHGMVSSHEVEEDNMEDKYGKKWGRDLNGKHQRNLYGARYTSSHCCCCCCCFFFFSSA
jgi:hypothetical protein